MLWVLKRTASVLLSTQNICLKLWVRKYLQFYAEKFCLSKPMPFLLFQEAIVKIMKMRKKITNAALQTELVEILKNMFLPSKKLIKEQIEWLIEHKYMRRDEDNINMFIYMS